MLLGSLAAGVREVMWLRVAEATSASYGDDLLASIRRDKAAARAALRASRALANPVAALDVLADASAHALTAARTANDARVDAFESQVARDAAVSFELLTFAEAETLRNRIDDLVVQMLRSVESRSRAEIWGLRVGRVAAIVVAIVALVWPLLRNRYFVHDVALHKPVMVSSVRAPGDPEALVDGRTRGTFAVQTNEGKNQFAMVDLERAYRVQRVRIFNRGDGWFDDSLPLALELSIDGVRFREVAKRTEHFDVWTIELGGADARFVRVSAKDGSYIALNEIEVYARE